MFVRSIRDGQVIITVNGTDFHSSMGHRDSWYCIIENDRVIVVCWNAAFPTVGVEVFEHSDPTTPVDEMFHQESGVYESVEKFDDLMFESDLVIAKEVWNIYKEWM